MRGSTSNAKSPPEEVVSETSGRATEPCVDDGEEGLLILLKGAKSGEQITNLPKVMYSGSSLHGSLSGNTSGACCLHLQFE